MIQIQDLWLIKKRGKMGNLDYNGEIAVDSHKGIILASYITIQYNRPLRTCSINGTSTIKFNRNITMKMPVNYQVSADNDYSTDEKHRISWKNMDLDGYISSRKLSRKKKKK